MALSYPYIFLLALSLAMDAFAVSISAGISMQKRDFSEALKIALAFGIFQAVMPIIGFFGASSFYDYICHVDHWIAFFLLAFIGGKMISEAVKKKGECQVFPANIKFLQLMVLAVATSIDALAAGVSLSMLCSDILIPVLMIGFVTFIFSFSGVTFGVKLGCKFGTRMEIVGGTVLILIGLKVLLGDIAGI
ncbi:MAG TPA: manganese efflux pump MntP family protein [bacterium]|nr:manganese efflux pump MntP family protein [bacterium]